MVLDRQETVEDSVVRLEREEQELQREIRRSLMLKSIQPWILRRWRDLARREALRVNRVSLETFRGWARFGAVVEVMMVKRRAAKEQQMRKEARQQRSIALWLLLDMVRQSRPREGPAV